MGQQQSHLRTDGTWARGRSNLLLCWAFNGGKKGFPAFPAPQLFHLCIPQEADGRMTLKLKWCKMQFPSSSSQSPHKGLAECTAQCIPAWKSWKKQGLHPTLSLSLAPHSQLSMGRAWLGFGSQQLQDPHTDNTVSHTLFTHYSFSLSGFPAIHSTCFH